MSLAKILLDAAQRDRESDLPKIAETILISLRKDLRALQDELSYLCETIVMVNQCVDQYGEAYDSTIMQIAKIKREIDSLRSNYKPYPPYLD